MKIEEGKFYRTRNGEKVGPAVRSGGAIYPWNVGGISVTDEGRFQNAKDIVSNADIVAQWDFLDAHLADELADEPILDLVYASPPLADTNPKSLVGQGKPPMHAVPSSALLHLGGAMADGQGKYGLFNWREHAVAASVYEDAIWRHMLAWRDREDVAADSKRHHLAHVMACCAILLDAGECGCLIDDRGVPGVAPQMIARLSKTPLDSMS